MASHIKNGDSLKMLRTTPAPEGVEKIIHLVNLLPPDFEQIPEGDMPTMIKELRRKSDEWPEEIRRFIYQSEIETNSRIEEYEQKFSHLPREIWDITNRNTKILGIDIGDMDALGFYNYLKQARSLLNSIIGLVEEYQRASQNIPSNLKGIIQPTVTPIQVQPMFFMRVGATKDGLKLIFDPADDMLITLARIEGAEHIRKCPICQKIFWSGRKDKFTCSPRCGDTNRSRKWRDEHPEHKLTRGVKTAEKPAQQKRRK